MHGKLSRQTEKLLRITESCLIIPLCGQNGHDKNRNKRQLRSARGGQEKQVRMGGSVKRSLAMAIPKGFAFSAATRQQIIAEIVARDIEKLCGRSLDTGPGTRDPGHELDA